MATNLSFSKSLLQQQFVKRVIFVTGFYSSCFLLFLGLCALTGNTIIISKHHLLNWDAQHYYKIARSGYLEPYLTAFFPLFPFTWKLLGIGAFGIVLFNALTYILAAAILGLIFKFTTKELLITLSVPSLVFMFLPYSEAFFYMGGMLLLHGFNSDKKSSVCLGLLICSISRPAAYILLPAVIICEFLFSSNSNTFLKTTATYVFLILLGLVITFAIQYYYTGQWFAFFESQSKWDNKLRLPALPLTTWGGGVVVRLDGTALFVGIIAIITIIKTVLLYAKKQALRISKPLLFSCLYLAGMSILVLMLRGGSLFSLNRFIFSSPFFAVALVFFMRNNVFTLKEVGYFMVVITLYWLLFASYVHIQAFLFFLIVSIYLAFYTLLNYTGPKISNIVPALIIICNMGLFVYFYYRFLANLWVA